MVEQLPVHHDGAVRYVQPRQTPFGQRAAHDVLRQKGIESVDILGYDGRLQWSVDGEGLHVTAPGIDSEFPVVVRVRPE